MKWTREFLGRKNQKGVALLIAIFTVTLILYLVTEIVYETNIEYAVNSGAVSRLKAYYAARSGLQLSLLRIKLFAKVQKQFGDKVPPSQRQMLDLVWSFPFAWPPLVPSEASSVDKDMIKEKVKESKMEATYITTISDEGSKIDLNDLASPSKALRELTKKLLMQVFENRMKNDEDWARKNADLKYEIAINNITDWEDSDKVSLNGGDEHQFYADLKSDEEGVESLPPNRAFRTIEELRMVAGVNEEIFNMLKDRVTIYGMRAINPNYATADVIKALDTSMKDEVVAKIIARRNDQKLGGPFKDENDFWGYANGEGAAVTPTNQKAIPLVFNQVMNFRIKSTGDFANQTREIEAVVFDFSAVAGAIANRLQTEAQTAGGAPPPTTNPSPPANNSTDPLPKGPPRIVYFIER